MPDATTLDPAEIEKFSRLADAWWDESGPFKPLHAFNPTRLDYVVSMAEARFEKREDGKSPLFGKNLLDVGCGGGLAAEPMARLGACVTGVDGSEKNIAVARLHAERSGISALYECREIGEQDREKFDVVLALEVAEHVSDVAAFLRRACAAAAPGGMVIVSTLNKTATSFLQAIVGAEYLLRWLPRGTHDWKKFLLPYDVMAQMERNGLEICDASGFTYDFIGRQWKRGKNLSVNYVVCGHKAP
ncbi:MAG: bifunctional 2-polyprenyl-6-hydroxyphenol methylase/3-demethylubiquinol 3-O-methyltransferase UbiG [Rickettsiales bacterium]